MAVLLMASAPDSASAVCQLMRQSGGQPARPATARRTVAISDGQHHLRAGPARTRGVRMARSLGRLNSSPITNIRNTTPNSPRWRMPSEFCASASALRPDQHADHQVAQHRRQPERAAHHHAEHCGQQVQQREFERGHAPMLLQRACPLGASGRGPGRHRIRAMSSRPDLTPATEPDALLRAGAAKPSTSKRGRAGPEGPHRRELRRAPCERSSRCAAAWS